MRIDNGDERDVGFLGKETSNMVFGRQFANVVIEMWNIMLAAPSNSLPIRNVERVLMTFCLMANLIVIGTFQGSLTTAFSTASYYKDIDTLQEADSSNLPIIVGSKCVSGVKCKRLVRLSIGTVL